MRYQGIFYPQRDRICARLKQLSSPKGLETICLYVKYILTVSSWDQYIIFFWRIWRDDDSGVSNTNDWWAKILPWTSNQANKECHICESRKKNIKHILNKFGMVEAKSIHAHCACTSTRCCQLGHPSKWKPLMVMECSLALSGTNIVTCRCCPSTNNVEVAG